MKTLRLFDVRVIIIISAPFLFSPSTTYAVPLSDLTVTGGSFSLTGSGVSDPLIPGAFASMSVDGSYDGSPPDVSSGDFSSTSVVTFNFNSGIFGPAAVYTAETDGINGPFPGVTGDLTGSNLTLDLSSWTWWWGANAHNQGSANVSAVTDPDGNFTASWDAPFVGGPFNGQTGSWAIHGHVSAIPLPGGLWSFGSGLIGLIGIAHKKSGIIISSAVVSGGLRTSLSRSGNGKLCGFVTVRRSSMNGK